MKIYIFFPPQMQMLKKSNSYKQVLSEYQNPGESALPIVSKTY